MKKRYMKSGKMQYVHGTDESATPTTGFTTSIPAGIVVSPNPSLFCGGFRV